MKVGINMKCVGKNVTAVGARILKFIVSNLIAAL